MASADADAQQQQEEVEEAEQEEAGTLLAAAAADGAATTRPLPPLPVPLRPPRADAPEAGLLVVLAPADGAPSRAERAVWLAEHLGQLAVSAVSPLLRQTSRSQRRESADTPQSERRAEAHAAAAGAGAGAGMHGGSAGPSTPAAGHAEHGPPPPRAPAASGASDAASKPPSSSPPSPQVPAMRSAQRHTQQAARCAILSVVPATRSPSRAWLEPAEAVSQPCVVTPSTRAAFIAQRYQLVFSIDVSPSMMMFSESGIGIDEAVAAVERCIKALVQPLRLPGVAGTVTPEVTVTVIAQAPSVPEVQPVRVLCEGQPVTPANVARVTGQLEAGMMLFETKLAINTAHTNGLLDGDFVRDLRAATMNTRPSDTRQPGEYGLTTVLRNGHLMLSMLPTLTGTYRAVVVVTDGVVATMTDVNNAALREALELYARQDIACTFVQVGARNPFRWEFGLVPNSELLLQAARATGGAYVYADDIADATYGTAVCQGALLSRVFQTAPPAALFSSDPSSDSPRRLLEMHRAAVRDFCSEWRRETPMEIVVRSEFDVRHAMARCAEQQEVQGAAPSTPIVVFLRQTVYQYTLLAAARDLLTRRCRAGFAVTTWRCCSDTDGALRLDSIVLGLYWRQQVRIEYTIERAGVDEATAADTAPSGAPHEADGAAWLMRHRHLRITLALSATYPFMRHFLRHRREPVHAHQRPLDGALELSNAVAYAACARARQPAARPADGVR